jgi:antitoxin ParD1/3/4
MNITLTPEQAQIIERKLKSGRYRTIDDLLLQAFQLLDEWEEDNLVDDPVWIAATQKKVDAARASLDRNGGTNGEVVVSQLLGKLRQARES